MTNQRKVIMDVLKDVTTHPTADQVYEMVRKRLPKISLGTVYRNLEILSDLSMIQKIEVGGTQKRFDGNIENHYHVRCRVCGRVEDLPIESMVFSGLEKLYSGADGYTDLTHKLELVGVCPECKNKRDRAD
ncbi:MAG: transcriptional repressor [Deltaproteobacteria bacterium]|uniref:Transcriptional repressor n=1 Tax=Candidatus Zymogenus saltonus TaxID=2844893 RepID=A0A9D8PNJ6_9DELT|nr:transcriptional repressor [Candidatus Zymogenus saltonus]